MTMDQKTAFDSGFRSFEDGHGECDFGPDSAAWAGEARLVAMWRAGWQRGQEDSCVFRLPPPEPELEPEWVSA